MASSYRAARWAHYRRVALAPKGGAAAAAPSPLLTDLVGYWDLDEASGTRADAHTNSLDLTDNNTVTSAAGVVGDAASFASVSSEYLSRDSESALQLGDIDFTFIAWVRLVDTTTNYGIFAKGRTSAAGSEFDCFATSGGAVTFRVRNAADSTNSEKTSTDTLTAGAFGLVEIYHDATANVIGIRINNGTAATASFSDGTFVGNARFTIGVLDDLINMNGRIDEVAFWKRLLTDDERTFLYNGGNGRSYADVVAYTG